MSSQGTSGKTISSMSVLSTLRTAVPYILIGGVLGGVVGGALGSIVMGIRVGVILGGVVAFAVLQRMRATAS